MSAFPGGVEGGKAGRLTDRESHRVEPGHCAVLEPPPREVLGRGLAETGHDPHPGHGPGHQPGGPRRCQVLGTAVVEHVAGRNGRRGVRGEPLDWTALPPWGGRALTGGRAGGSTTATTQTGSTFGTLPGARDQSSAPRSRTTLFRPAGDGKRRTAHEPRAATPGALRASSCRSVPVAARAAEQGPKGGEEGHGVGAWRNFGRSAAIGRGCRAKTRTAAA